MPVFNAGRHVEAALASICAQDYTRLEIIVIDDGSSDDTFARVERMARNDRRIRILSRENRGLIASLNEGLALAQGDLIARMDGDDIAYPQRISRQVEAFETSPGLALCATEVDTLEMGRLWRTPAPGAGRHDLRVLGLFFTVLIHPTVMFDKRVLGDELHYDERYPHAEDFDLFRRIFAENPVRLLKTPLLAYRLHTNRVSFKHKQIQQHSHLRIVAENLAADGFDLDVEALPALAEPHAIKALETIDRVVACLGELDRQIPARPPPLRQSYEAGAGILGHLLMRVLLDAGQAPLAREFLVRSGKWQTIRRRERLILSLTAPMPALASALMHQSNQFQLLLELPTSRPASSLRSGVFVWPAQRAALALSHGP